VVADAFSFEKLGPIEARLLKLAGKLGYLILTDRTDRAHEDRIGRFDCDEGSAEPYRDDALCTAAGGYLIVPPTPRAEADDGDEDEDSGDDESSESGDSADSDDDDDSGWPPEYDDGDGDREPDPPTQRSGPISDLEIARAACRWLRDCAARNTVGDPMRRFRVRIYGPKASDKLDSGSFVCRNHDYADEVDTEAADAAVRELRIPQPTFDQSAKDSTLRGLKALGDYYAQWGQIVLGSVGQLQGVNNSMLARLHRQLQESRGQVDELVASILEYRHNEVEAHERRRLEERAGDTRSELARDALQQLGTAATAFLAGRALPPDLLETFGAISASPELTDALRDPRVRALMKEPDNLRGLAAMLHAAGHQAQAAGQPPGEAGAGPPDDGDPPPSDPDIPQPDPPAAG
jgi:hypothetical protein